MKHFIALLCLIIPFAAVAQTDATLLGNKPVVEGAAYWGAGVGRTLHIIGNKYMRDSGAANTRVLVDTTRNSVGGAGACTENIVSRTAAGITPQSHFTISYSGKATNTSADAIRMYLATQDKTPTGGDSSWVLTHYIYGDSIIPQTHTRSNFTTAYKRVKVSLYAEGQNLRVCFARASTGGPGNSDTVSITQVWPRGW